MIGIIATIVPLVLHVTRSSVVITHGELSQTYRDWVAIGCGPVAMVSGVAAIVTARAHASGRWLALGALIVVLGGYHVARGFGMLG